MTEKLKIFCRNKITDKYYTKIVDAEEAFEHEGYKFMVHLEENGKWWTVSEKSAGFSVSSVSSVSSGLSKEGAIKKAKVILAVSDIKSGIERANDIKLKFFYNEVYGSK